MMLSRKAPSNPFYIPLTPPSCFVPNVWLLILVLVQCYLNSIHALSTCSHRCSAFAHQFFPCPRFLCSSCHLTRCFSAMPFLKKMQAGPMGNCMGAGRVHQALMSRWPLLPPPLQQEAQFLIASILCQLFLPFLGSPQFLWQICDSSWEISNQTVEG